MARKSLIAAAAVTMLTLGLLSWSAPGWSQPAAGRGGGRGGATAPAAPVPTGKASVVRVAGGRAQGILFGDVAVYRGLPYAAPPVGNLRWRAPQAVVAWQGVRDASAYGKSCTAPPDGAEDCLFLNVYAPANGKPGARVPVMIRVGGNLASTSGCSAGETIGDFRSAPCQ